MSQQELQFGKLKLTQTGHFAFEEVATRWLIEGLWTAAGTGVFSGPSKEGKTWLLIEACVSVASGAPFLGRYAVQQGPVILASPEGPTRELEERIRMVCARKDVPRHLLPLYIATFDNLLIDSKPDQEVIRKAALEVRPALIALDPFARFFGGAESCADDVKRATNFLNELSAESRAAVMMTHHDSKDGTSLRGSGVLLSFGDNYWFLKAAGGNRRLEFRMKHSAAPAPLPLELNESGGNTCMVIGPAAAAAPREPKLEDRIGELMGTNPAKRWTVRDLRQEIGGDFTKYKTALNTLRGLRLIKEAKGGGYLLNKAVWFGKTPKGGTKTKPDIQAVQRG